MCDFILKRLILMDFDSDRSAMFIIEGFFGKS